MPRGDDQFNLRLPDGMRPLIAGRARANLRSMNAEIVHILTIALGPEGKSTTGQSLPAHPAADRTETACKGNPATHG